METSIRRVEQKPSPNRKTGLDILRGCAILFVISGHFLGFGTNLAITPFRGSPGLIIEAMGHFFFGMGVPIFIMLTGYLNGNKTLSKVYYKGCIRVLLAYLFFAILCLLFQDIYLEETLSIRQYVGKILRFNAIPYGWYIEMWIGLFLLTPFLNLLYQAIPTQKQKQLLIITMFTMTALPDLFNRYGFHLVPGFWAQCFPLTFFFIGQYIREFQPRVILWKAVLVIIGICLINPLFTLFISPGHTLLHISGAADKGVFGTIMAYLFFLLIYKVEINIRPLKYILMKISLLSLDMYLCCWIFDRIFHPYFKDHYYVNQAQYGWFYFIVVPIIFLCSLFTAQLKEWLFKGIAYVFRTL